MSATRLLRYAEVAICVAAQAQHLCSLTDYHCQNVEHARTLLLRLEHNTQRERTQQRKHSQQSELAKHRQLVKRLTERLYELNRRDDEKVGPQAEEEDIIDEYFTQHVGPGMTANEASHSKGPSTSSVPTATSEGLRARNTQAGNIPDSALLTKSTPLSNANELFANKQGRQDHSKPGLAPADMSAEKQLEHQDSIQADLTSLLVAQAQKLKLGSLEFQQSLTEDEEIRARAESAISKSASSMDVASRSMGALRRMSEGRWWWQRYIMFILIFFMWFVLLALVFIGPKLRF